jgi:hypothetical protein
MSILFDSPIKTKQIRFGVYANLYRNGVIEINGIKYLGYSLTEAINIFRAKYPYSRK